MSTDPPADPPPLWLRLWLSVPDGAFRVVGAGFFLAYLAGRIPEYAGFPEVGHHWIPILGTLPDGTPIQGDPRYLPLGKILVDVTFLLVAVSFALRHPPRQRADSARRIVIPVVAGFWPLIPFLLSDAMQILHAPGAEALDAALAFGELSWPRFVLGVGLVSLGNAIDVWGYGTLFRSFSIVAEARELRVSGPYRWVRHPIYLGQFIAQAGVWLVLVQTHPAWWAFYAAFVGMQLYRSWVEDRVLGDAFGDEHAAFRARAWWFF